ncbi:MAG: ribonuclease HI [Oligoflexales bacterium]|nr:ribonuclease HI [Oligoflexales bacterium]
MQSIPSFLIFCDGACKKNPGPGGWGAVLVKLPPVKEQDQDEEGGSVLELGASSLLTTNNEMELLAVISALKELSKQSGHLTILSDSEYVIRGITQWVHGWKKNGWMNSQGQTVANLKHWQTLDQLTLERKGLGSLLWKSIPAHAGVVGNERADVIASACALQQDPKLYSGNFSQYRSQDILNWELQTLEGRAKKLKNKNFYYK